MSIRGRVARLTKAVGDEAGDDPRTVVLLPVPAGQPIGPPRWEGTRLVLPHPADERIPPLSQPVRYKLVVGFDPVDLV